MVGFIPREEILSNLRKKIDAGEPIVIAGVSLGETAKAAEAGGADLLLFYTSGRYRMMGRGSLIGMLPYENANELTLNMAIEIAPVVEKTPVIAGVCATDPFISVRSFLGELKEIGVSGVINYPTISMYGEEFMKMLEYQGITYELEVNMIRDARKLGMLTTPYAFSAEEAEKMAGAGADVIIIHVGYKRPLPSIEETIEKVGKIVEAAKKVNPDVLMIAHGGPIVDPESFRKVYEKTDVVGFMGFTAIERVPAVKAIQESVKRFKAVKKQ